MIDLQIKLCQDCIDIVEAEHALRQDNPYYGYSDDDVTTVQEIVSPEPIHYRLVAFKSWCDNCNAEKAKLEKERQARIESLRRVITLSEPIVVASIICVKCGKKESDGCYNISMVADFVTKFCTELEVNQWGTKKLGTICGKCKEEYNKTIGRIKD